MLTLPALKIQQFNQEFYLLNLAAADVERLVRFEVLGDARVQGTSRRRKSSSSVNWELLEKRVGTSEKAFQRPIIRQKIEELAAYYQTCREQEVLPAIPGAVILTTEEKVEFSTDGTNPFLGVVRISEEEGTLRALDGQHRLLALHAMLHDDAATEADRTAARRLQVPAILLAGLPDDHVVELFVTINAKHTRLNQSLLISLSGRQLYGDSTMAFVHDVIRKLNDDSSSPLHGEIKLLGVGHGRVQQSGLAQEMKQVFAEMESREPALWDRFQNEASAFLLTYTQEIARIFETAWNGRKYSIKTTSALRAFFRVTPDVLSRSLATGLKTRPDAIRAAIAPWRERIGDNRFETAGGWRAKVAGGGKETIRLLARELIAALAEVPQ